MKLEDVEDLLETLLSTVREREVLIVKLEGAEDQKRLLFEAKNYWANRARKAEAELLDAMKATP